VFKAALSRLHQTWVFHKPCFEISTVTSQALTSSKFALSNAY